MARACCCPLALRFGGNQLIPCSHSNPASGLVPRAPSLSLWRWHAATATRCRLASKRFGASMEVGIRMVRKQHLYGRNVCAIGLCWALHLVSCHVSRVTRHLSQPALSLPRVAPSPARPSPYCWDPSTYHLDSSSDIADCRRPAAAVALARLFAPPDRCSAVCAHGLHRCGDVPAGCMTQGVSAQAPK